jgi:hypothetical protein
MDVNQINAYLTSAREIIGDRSQAEIEYDNAVVANLNTGEVCGKLGACSGPFSDELASKTTFPVAAG